MTFTLLLTCVGGELAPQVIRGLKESDRHDVTVVGVDTRADATGRHFTDRFQVVPRGDDPSYPGEIAALVARFEVDLVLPTSDEEALGLAARRSDVEAGGCRLACADSDVLETLADKSKTYKRAEAFGIPVPEWRQVSSLDGLEQAVSRLLSEFGGAVVKPAASRGGRNVSVVYDDLTGAAPNQESREIHVDWPTFRSDHLEAYAGLFPAIVMRRLVGSAFDVDMLAWRGEPVRVVPRRRLGSVLPYEGYTMVGNADLFELGRRIVEGFELSWLYDCDVMYDAQGTPGILEINPRPSGSIAMTITAGVPLMDDLISLAKGEDVPDVESPVGRVVVPYKSLAVAR